ncbi:hypothetical protein FB382_002502 [Nocardioides ginsengisegetis]|uniref:Excreted virulence factor EspC, type VII ESX diderm n=1 Tax=Nocardioides ginsengisegetis TaxID=661491 RepID=A0A7W3J0W2_9ACTN|nr:type VII secretion target [Nocardioides ginsengisegetis]MBA8804211.1 hypothetical protein [Nocardioides ginsengisegetis]
MSGEIAVVTDAMRRHAGDLDRLASWTYQGVEAGRTVSTPGDAYGVLCSFIGAAMVPAQATGIASTALAVASLGATAAQLRAVAEVFDEVDDVVGSAMNRFRGNS